MLSGGKAFSILDGGVQQKIQQLIHHQISSKEEEHHQVYWLRGGPASSLPSPAEEAPQPACSPTLPDPIHCGSSSSVVPTPLNLSHSPMPSISTSITSMPVSVMSPILTRPVRKPLMRIPTEEDGDYATLRDLPLVTLPEEPADMHETSSSSDSSGVDSGFGSGSNRPVIINATPLHSPRLTRDLCNPYGYVKPKMTTFAAQQPGYSNTVAGIQHHKQSHHVQHSPFHSLPMGLRPMSSHMNVTAHSVMVHHHHQTEENRRPAMQACLLAGQGLESNQQRMS